MYRLIRIQTEDFSLDHVYREMRERQGAALGAVAGFVGLVRDHNPAAAGADQVKSLTLEHYPGMTEASIDAILDKAQMRWPLLEVQVIHRIGTLAPTEQIVMVVAGSGHRDAAFAAAEFIMDYLKTEAVFWKKEQAGADTHWVQSTAQDHQRADGWRVDSEDSR